MLKLTVKTDIDINKSKKKMRRDLNVAELERLGRGAVYVGWPESAIHNDDGKAISIAKYARYANYGSVSNNQEPRPFFTEGFYFDKYVERRADLSKQLMKQVAKKQINAKKALELMGIEAVNNVRDAIQTGPWAPNKPSTLARKLAKTKGKRSKRSPNPLIDTGDMIGSVTYIVAEDEK